MNYIKQKCVKIILEMEHAHIMIDVITLMEMMKY